MPKTFTKTAIHVVVTYADDSEYRFDLLGTPDLAEKLRIYQEDTAVRWITVEHNNVLHRRDDGTLNFSVYSPDCQTDVHRQMLEIAKRQHGDRKLHWTGPYTDFVRATLSTLREEPTIEGVWEVYNRGDNFIRLSGIENPTDYDQRSLRSWLECWAEEKGMWNDGESQELYLVTPDDLRPISKAEAIALIKQAQSRICLRPVDRSKALEWLNPDLEAQVRAFAESNGSIDALNAKLEHLRNSFPDCGNDYKCSIGGDSRELGYLSFNKMIRSNSESPWRSACFGGLVYHDHDNTWGTHT